MTENSPPLYKQFKLLTAGTDQELDAISIIIEAMGGLQGHEIGRILDYLKARYTHHV